MADCTSYSYDAFPDAPTHLPTVPTEHELRILTGYVEWAMKRHGLPRDADPEIARANEKNRLMVLRWAANIPEDVYR
jgi:hypothetical protein